MFGSRGRVLVAMSGGVDSSVAAALLQREGYDVVGCFMRLGSPGEALDDGPVRDDAATCDPSRVRIGKQGCCSINDAADARTVAGRLDVPFYVCNFKRDFGRIIEYFVDEYNAGRTPNPCVRCNDWLKFGKLHEYAKQLDADFVASGHYAQIDHAAPAGPWLRRGADHGKDQSYVLFGAPRDRLHEMLLPIGAMQKSDVRALAESMGLPVFNKPDSQEICFVPDNDYARLVTSRTPDAVRPGAFIDESGETIGTHEGQQHFTIGQRRRIGIARPYPLYVINRNAETNEVMVGPKSALAATGCSANETNWFIDPPAEWRPCHVKIRYNSAPVPGRVRATGADALEVRFDDTQYGVAPGQAVVCYDDDVVLGGGWIIGD